ncbi:MAG: TlpA family protein disulfide reductase [Phycisphaeraceae bacterium]|nr:MAG: TlpA family protein disulfide reductase [Phycisphaeraceae bacterium]
MRRERNPIGVMRVGGWALALSAGLSVPALGQMVEPEDPKGEPEPAPALAPVLSPTDPPAVKADGAPAVTRSHDATALARFERATTALREARTLQFEASFEVKGYGSDLAGTSRAVVLARQADGVWQYRMSGTGRGTSKAPETAFDAAFLGADTEWVDEAAKKVVIKPSRQARGNALAGANNLRRIGDLLGGAPFKDELASPTITTRPDEAVGGVACEVVRAEAANGSTGITVWIGKDDGIVRRVATTRTTPRGETSSVVELGGVKLNEAITAEQLRVPLPEGFTREGSLSSGGQGGGPIKVSGPITQKATVIEPASPGEVTEPGVPAATPAPVVVAPDRSASFAGTTTPPMPKDPFDLDDAEDEASRAMSGMTPEVMSTPARAPAAGPATTLPEFEFETLDGSKVSASAWRGKPAVVMLWGTWSLSARAALREMQDLAESPAMGGVGLAAIAVRQKDPMSAAAMARDLGVTYPVVAGAGGAGLTDFVNALQPGAFPAIFVVDPSGAIIHRAGFRRSDVFNRVREVLAPYTGSVTPAPSDAPAPAGVTPPGVSEDEASGGSLLFEPK